MSNSVSIFEVADRDSSLDYFKKKYNVNTEEELQQIFKKAYYEGNALITDATYDKLFPVDPLGYQVQATVWPKFTHTVESSSMPKFKKIEDAKNFMTTTNFNVQVIEHKLDGINLKLYYEQGKLAHAVTRGSGIEGEDILPNAINFKQIPLSINTDLPIVVEGEITISDEAFNEIKQNTDYSNRRNAVAGIARRLDGANSNHLSFYAYTLYKAINDKFKRVSVLDGREELTSMGFVVPENLLLTGKSLDQIYEETGQVRDTNMSYIVDGLVIKVAENQFALKFPANTGETTITGYRWELSSTYKLVPVALYDTINIGGANYTKASLASAQNYININAPIGSTVEIARANEVIPYLKSVVSRADIPLSIPTNCPICGTPLEWQGANLVCNNENCGSRFYSRCQRLVAVLDIRGFKFASIGELIKKNIITKPSQILTLTSDQLEQAGKSRPVAIKTALAIRERLRTLGDVAILYMLNLPGISLSTLLELEKLAGSKGKSVLQVAELQSQEDYMLIQSVLKASKANTLIKYMSTPEGRSYYEELKTIKHSIV